MTYTPDSVPPDSTLLWALRDDRPQRIPWVMTDCNVIEELDGRWTVTVSRGAATLVSQTCESRAAALARAEELQRVLMRSGWTDRPSA